MQCPFARTFLDFNISSISATAFWLCLVDVCAAFRYPAVADVVSEGCVAAWADCHRVQIVPAVACSIVAANTRRWKVHTRARQPARRQRSAADSTTTEPSGAARSGAGWDGTSCLTGKAGRRTGTSSTSRTGASAAGLASCGACSSGSLATFIEPACTALDISSIRRWTAGRTRYDQFRDT